MVILKTFFTSFILVLNFTSCAYLSAQKQEQKQTRKKVRYDYTDSSGRFQLIRESGFNKSKNSFYVKTLLLPENGVKDKFLEKTITVSEFGKLKTQRGSIPVMRPKGSRYVGWFESKRYRNKMKVNPKKKTMEIELRGPKVEYWGNKVINFPTVHTVYCYLSQLPECVKSTEFLNMSLKKKSGEMNFYLIWDSYPFLEQQVDIPSTNLFSPAKFSFDGISKSGDIRFSLEVDGQTIFYHFTQNLELSKIFWVSQGISIVKSEFQ